MVWWCNGKASDLWSTGREFNPWPRCSCVLTLGKLFTPICLDTVHSSILYGVVKLGTDVGGWLVVLGTSAVLSSLCAMTVADKATYQTLLPVAVFTSSCARLTSSMGRLSLYGLVRKCTWVSAQPSCLQSRQTSLIAAVSICRIYWFLLLW